MKSNQTKETTIKIVTKFMKATNSSLNCILWMINKIFNLNCQRMSIMTRQTMVTEHKRKISKILILRDKISSIKHK
jgi:hypothetical protein